MFERVVNVNERKEREDAKVRGGEREVEWRMEKIDQVRNTKREV